jgi:hypothetical protein
VRLKKLIGVAAIAAALPIAAGAATVTEGIDFGGTYDVPGNYSSVVMFENGEDGGTLTWNFRNTSAVAQAVTIASATVEQFLDFAYFTNGTTTSLNGDVETTEQGMPEGFFLDTVIAPGSIATLAFQYGTVFETDGTNGQGGGNDVVFDFNIASSSTVIPLPASVFMLLAALGGIGVLGRRRKAAMG